MTPRLAAVLVAACLVTAGCLAGCQRKPRFVPERPDSTATDLDSLTVAYRQIQREWEAGNPSADLAGATAAALREALARRESTEWPRRAQRLLDSLGVGAEIAAGECALAVNLFSRADPAGDSWPFLYWCAPDGPRHQAVEGKSLRLSQIAARGIEAAGTESAGKSRAKPAVAKGPGPGVAALFQRRAAGGFQPMVMVWAADPALATWRLVQTLGPDSLGGVGTGEMAGADTTVELTARTYQPNAYFDECPTCPHVFHVRRFRWGAAGFRRTADQIVPSPYTTFVQFIQALATGDLGAADDLASDPALVDEARNLGWSARTGKWRVAPGVEETPERMVFYRGANEAYAVRFAPRGRGWVVAGFEATERAVE